MLVVLHAIRIIQEQLTPSCLLVCIYASFSSGSTWKFNSNNFVISFERENEEYSHEKLEDSDQIIVGGMSLLV